MDDICLNRQIIADKFSRKYIVRMNAANSSSRQINLTNFVLLEPSLNRTLVSQIKLRVGGRYRNNIVCLQSTANRCANQAIVPGYINVTRGGRMFDSRPL